MIEYSETNRPVRHGKDKCQFCGGKEFHHRGCTKLVGGTFQKRNDMYVIYTEHVESGFYGFIDTKKYNYNDANIQHTSIYKDQKEPAEHWVLHESLFIESKIKPVGNSATGDRAKAQGVSTMKRPYKKSKSLTLSKVYRPWEEYAEGDFVVGKVVGFHKDNYDKKSVVVEVEEASFVDKKKAKEVTGKNLVLNSCGQLEKQIENEEIQIGHILEVIYKGKSTIEKGKYKGKEAHVLEINLLEEDDGTGDGGDSEANGNTDSGDEGL